MSFTKRCSLCLAGVLWCALQGSATAAVREASADSAWIEIVLTVDAPAERVYAGLLQWGRWWDTQHSYSGHGENFSLSDEAGACLCERWAQGSIEHGRVIAALHGRLLRLEAPLGPLQGLAVKAILTFELEPLGAVTRLKTTFRINGSPATGLDKVAPGVDAVVTEQVARLKRYVETGGPAG